MGLRQTRSGGQPGIGPDGEEAEKHDQTETVEIKRDGRKVKAKFGAVALKKLGDDAERPPGYRHPQDPDR